MLIWRCNIYVVNSNSVNKYIDPRTSTYPQKVLEPLRSENIPHQDYGYFMVYPNITNFLICSVQHIHWVNKNQRKYIDDNGIHKKDPLKPGYIFIHE